MLKKIVAREWVILLLFLLPSPAVMATYLWVTTPEVGGSKGLRFDSSLEAVSTSMFLDGAFRGPSLYISKIIKRVMPVGMEAIDPKTGAIAVWNGTEWVINKADTKKSTKTGRKHAVAQVGEEILKISVPAGLSEKEILTLAEWIYEIVRKSQWIVKKRTYWNYVKHYMEYPSEWIRWWAWLPFILAYSSQLLIRSLVWSIRALRESY